MQTEELIAAEEFCFHHKIEISFIDSLTKSGLLETTMVEDKLFLPVEELRLLEKMVRFYYEMDINLEGIETINYLLQRMNEMQQQIIQLSNQLSMYTKE